MRSRQDRQAGFGAGKSLGTSQSKPGSRSGPELDSRRTIDGDEGAMAATPTRAEPSVNQPPLPEDFFSKLQSQPTVTPQADKDFQELMGMIPTEDRERQEAEPAERPELESSSGSDREEFEDYVRMQRVEDLKKAVTSKKKQIEFAEESAAHLVKVPEGAQSPAIVLTRKRKLTQTVVQLQSDINDETSDYNDDDDDEEDKQLLDWRSKKISKII